jgi:GNAT superfamily N-acetyltransferase
MQNAHVHVHVHVRPSTANDVGYFVDLQRLCYAPELHEGPEVFMSIVKRGMSHSAENDAGVVIGYALAHPIKDVGSPPGLGGHDDDTDQEQQQQQHLFVHDVAVHPVWRGTGVASRLVDAVFKMAGFKSVSLVSVQGSRPFWERHGFVDSGSAANVDSYGPGALHMKKASEVPPPQEERGHFA